LKAKLHGLYLSLALLVSVANQGHAQASGDLVQIYGLVKNVICAYLSFQGQSCPLPSDIIAIAPDGTVEGDIQRARNVQITYIEGREEWTKRMIIRYLNRTDSGELSWFVPADKAKALNDWLKPLLESKKDAKSKAKIVTVSQSDILETISRFPFVFLGDKVYIHINQGNWALPAGEITSSVLSVMRSLLGYLSSREVRDAQNESEAR